MTNIEVCINGKAFPCRVTMGAMRRYKLLTGEEASDIDLTSLSSVAELLFCCTASACNADRVEFPYSVEDFCDALDTDEFTRLAGLLADGDGKADGAEKKRA